ncbi:MAG TPA: squalene/phytoene synthase family protein [Candidatus Sulfotelmatobacter sp.]|nr:squalene/phytoene synthase family protein [Candidatus Sulfotelmatobacter sp.]
MVAQETSVDEAVRESRLLLPRVSRTFALGIKLLPARLEAPVRLGYLLCRIADTIEDDLALSATRKAELLATFLTCFDEVEAADSFGNVVPELTSNAEYLDLVAATGRVFMLYRALDPPTRAILHRWVGEMVRGMRSFVIAQPNGIRIRTTAEFQEYCYYVAGTVGHLLTELWHEHSILIGERTYARLLDDCEAFGEALQTVNILKDIAWDAEHENAIYVPADALAAAGSAHDRLLEPALRAANRTALAPLMTLAQDDIERALRYIEAIPAAAMRIRLFCVLPILFAIATMRELERTDEMLVPGGAVKIGRAEVRAVVLAATTSTLTNPTLRWLADRVRKRPFTFGA